MLQNFSLGEIQQKEHGGGKGICQHLTNDRSGYQSLSFDITVAEAVNVFPDIR